MGAAWARLQTEEPGFARSPADQAFADELVDWLRLHEAMLMDEVVPHLFRYLRDNPGAPERTEFSHVLVDEYQDLNRAEQDALELLATSGSICVIGDDDQSIYRFRHAHPEGIRQWASKAETDQHAIDECWRCPTTIVRMANALISHNPDRLNDAMSEREANGPGEVVVRQYGTNVQEAKAVSTKIKQLIESGVHPREIIVLAQRRSFATPIFRRLKADDIPTKSYYAEQALDTLDAQERFAILKLFLKNEDRIALRWLLGFGHTQWRTNPYRRILEHIRQTGDSPWTALNALADGDLTIPYTSTLVDRFNDIKTELAELGQADTLDDFIEMWLPEAEGTELLREAVDECKDGLDSPSELFSLHKSKGLSSPYVFIVGCVEGLMPARLGAGVSQDERDAQLEEDRRLFYVGITRAKSNLPDRVGYLGLTYPREMPAAEAFGSQIIPVRVIGNTARLQPSRFLGEMAPHLPGPQFNTPL